MIGAPNSGVTAFSGRIVFEPGIIIRILHNSAMIAPAKIVTGSSILWLDVPNISRATCGTASPIKEMGPQKAVVVAVSKPVQKRIQMRVRLIFTPRLAAYNSPRRRAFSGFIINRERSSPMLENMTKYGICPNDTPEKLPSPHMTYA